MPPQPFLLDRWARQSRRLVRSLLAVCVIIETACYFAISGFHLSPYWWVVPGLIGLLIVVEVFGHLARVRHPENDPFFKAHVLPHSSLEIAAFELDRDLGDPARHRRFALRRGALVFTEHWLVVDGEDDLDLMHYSDCVWYKVPGQEWVPYSDELLVASAARVLVLKARSEDGSAIAAELDSRTAACNIATAPCVVSGVRLLPAHLVWGVVKFRTVPYTAIQRIYNSVTRRADQTGPILYCQTIVVHNGREDVLYDGRVASVTREGIPTDGGMSVAVSLLAALAARAPQAKVGYEKKWYEKPLWETGKK